MDKQDQYNDFTACLRELAPPKAELRAALNANMISMRNTNNQFRDLMDLAHEHDLLCGGLHSAK
ncbi:hypothetical protein N7449_001716 [Penicillium cf. viridicatum]|uniref:Uncharacterized protein n=1 Tax=Penicillium cf. viridicatum TaxID=2972119 RepID=A0A9W9T9I0_9EURO|nr:hypothetical protein N7449_001716 [Penicillium cf. viridicatum]